MEAAKKGSREAAKDVAKEALVGFAVKPKHFASLGAADLSGVGLLEFTTEDFFGTKVVRPRDVLFDASRGRSVSLHGIGLSLGSTDALSRPYLEALAELVEAVRPRLVSDHLSWSSFDGRYGHDLLPLPFTAEAVAHVSDRVKRVQDRLGRELLLENVASYLAYPASTMPEWAFLGEVAERSHCGLLLDVANLFANGENHHFDTAEYLARLPRHRVRELHLAGNSRRGRWVIDSHDGPVPDEVWSLFRQAVHRFGPLPTLFEWDRNAPPLERLVAETRTARTQLEAARSELESAGDPASRAQRTQPSTPSWLIPPGQS